MSSHSAPTLQELQSNPLGALSKGWGLFSSAVAVATKEINASVVQPGMARAQELAQGQGGGNEDLRKYLAGIGMNAKEASTWISQRAGEGFEGLNGAAKSRGLDLDEHLQKLGISSTGQMQGYGNLDRAEGGNLTPHNGRDSDFFESWDDHPAGKQPQASVPAPAAAPLQGKPQAGKKKDDWNDDEWNEF
jgi:ADP-ribosylation factor GTPase-activating protein 1